MRHHPAYVWGLLLGLVLFLPQLLWGQAQLINGHRTHAGATNYGITTGTGTAYILTLNAAMPAYIDGTCFLLRTHLANTGVATLNVNGLGPKTLKKFVTGTLTDLVAGDLGIGQKVLACYDSAGATAMHVLSLGGGGGGAGGTTMVIQELDGSPVGAFSGLKFPNGTVTDNGDGTATIATGAGGGSDILTVGNCVSGACLNGTPTGGTQLALYDGNSHKGTLLTNDLTADRTYALPDASGTFCLSGSVCTGYQTALPNVTNDAQLKRTANDFSSFPAKAVPVSADVLLIEDSAAGGVKKAITVGALPSGGETGSGDVQSVGACAGGDCYTSGNPSGALYIAATAAPGNPPPGSGVLYFDTASQNMAVKDAVGTVRHGVQTKAPVTNEFVTGLNAAGVVSTAQPAFAHLTGQATTTQIADDAVTLAKLADQTPGTILGRSLGTGNPEALTPAQAKTVLGLDQVDNTSDAVKNSAVGELTNKKITPRLLTPGATTTPILIDTDLVDVVHIAELNQTTTFSIPTASLGTRRNAQLLEIVIFTTVVRQLIFTEGTNGFANEYGAPLPTQSRAGGWVRYGFIWNSTTNKWGFAFSTQFTAVTYRNLPITGIKTPLFGGIATPDRSEQWDRLLFDAATPECAVWQFPMPGDFVGSPQLRIHYSMRENTIGSAFFFAALKAFTPGDGIDVDLKAFGPTNACDDTAVPTPAGKPDVITCALANTDNLAAGDMVQLQLCNNIADTALGDREVMGVELSYAR